MNGLSNGSTVVEPSSSYFCPRCLISRFDSYGADGIQEQGTKDHFQVRAHDDGLKIECVGGTPCPHRNIILKGASTLTHSTKNESGENIQTLRSKQTLHSLFMELAVAHNNGSSKVDLSRVRLFEDARQELSKLIQSVFWNNLTRRLDLSNSAVSGKDPKDWTDDPRPRIFVPYQASKQYAYYSQVAKDYPDLRLDVILLPESGVTPKLVQKMNSNPGALALAMEEVEDENGTKTMRALPFIVPGGRFNEMYGWDSYFQALGLLANGYIDVCESMVRNFCFCIQHYGKILNANRTYYLGRSQPPFLTSMGLAVFDAMDKRDPKALEFIRLVALAAMKDYYTTWTAPPRYHGETGLSRYGGDGIGFPPEVEPGHFEDIIAACAKKHNMDPGDFSKAYDNGEIEDAEMDEYLDHDRAGRESGHDTTYRFVNKAAHLATVDLNSCLYKYESDIAHIIKVYFNGQINVDDLWRAKNGPATEAAETWTQRAARRREAIDKYLWSQEKGMYFDYDTKSQTSMSYECATTLWPLWAGAASQDQANKLVANAIPKLEAPGGLVASTLSSRGSLTPSRPARQWDYPYGWAPHQMLAWDGLRKYAHDRVAARLAYRWVSMVLKTFADHNGLVVEKYDVTKTENNQVVEAEYGNQGSDFSSEVQTGFGWTNASVVYGLQILQYPCETCPGNQRGQLASTKPSNLTSRIREYIVGAVTSTLRLLV